MWEGLPGDPRVLAARQDLRFGVREGHGGGGGRGRSRAGPARQTWVQGGQVVPARGIATAQGKPGKGGGQGGLGYTKFFSSFTSASHWPNLMKGKGTGTRPAPSNLRGQGSRDASESE